MSPPHLHPNSTLALLFVIAAGVAGNYLRLSLFFVQKVGIGRNMACNLIAQVPAAPYDGYLQGLYANDLAVMLLIAMLAIFPAVSISRRLARKLSDLANKLIKPHSKIIEGQSAEKQLGESEEWLSQLAENSREVFWMKDLDKNQLTYISPAYEEIWGCTSDLYKQSKFWMDTIYLEDCERVLAVTEKIPPGEYDEEYRIVRSDGSVRWIQDRAFPIRNELGEIYRIVGIVTDISKRKQAEAEILYALEKERQLNELKSRFINTTSHEFRNPLTAILMSAKLLEKFGYQATEEKKRLYLERIQVASRQMVQLLDEVLLIGKAEAGKLEFKPVLLELEKFCRELVEEMQFSAGSNYVITFVSDGKNTTACLDEKLLRYILSNLLSNAVKYSPRGGEVNFSMSCEQGEVLFRIQDQGIGIPVTDQAELFNFFHRGSNVSTISGTGLGLSIVKQCVDLHGGKITVDSQVGLGTTLSVTIPLSPDINK